jgi:predicted TIM-barrel fold metal-dependent hydrolase
VFEMIIDCHSHIGVSWYGWWKNEVTEGEFIKTMDKYKINKACVNYWSIQADQGNDIIDAFAKKYPDRIIPFACIIPHWYKESVQEVERVAKKLNMKGLKLHPSANHYPAHSPLVFPVVEKAIEFGLPMLFHCGGDQYSHPHNLGDLAKRYPKATFIMGHIGEEACLEAIEVAKQHENIYLDTTGYFNLYHLLHRVIDRVGEDRIVFGTDFVACNPGPEIAKVRDVDLNDRQVEKIMGLNMARLLGIK